MTRIPDSIRYPDYGVPHTLVRSNSSPHKVLRYAKFVNCEFNIDDYLEFRSDNLRRDYVVTSLKRLVNIGFVEQVSESTYKVTPLGVSSLTSIAMRDSAREHLRRVRAYKAIPSKSI